MDGYRRYAIYYLPEPGPLAAFGATWLGWDVLDGCARAHPEVAVDVARLTDTPRKYGFHGTVKPPFYLAEGTTAQGLHRAMHDLAETAAPVTLDGLALSTLGKFLALKPIGDQSALGALATRVVQDLDRFRAPPSAAELERRRAKPLSPAQDANLAAWGYPYVLDDFRFHMTLSGSIQDDADRQAALDTIAAQITPHLPRPFHVTSLCLVGSDAQDRFRLIHRYPLLGA